MCHPAPRKAWTHTGSVTAPWYSSEGYLRDNRFFQETYCFVFFYVESVESQNTEQPTTKLPYVCMNMYNHMHFDPPIDLKKEKSSVQSGLLSIVMISQTKSVSNFPGRIRSLSDDHPCSRNHNNRNQDHSASRSNGIGGDEKSARTLTRCAECRRVYKTNGYVWRTHRRILSYKSRGTAEGTVGLFNRTPR